MKNKRPVLLLITVLVLGLNLLISTKFIPKNCVFHTPIVFFNRSSSEPPGIYLAVPFGKLQYGDKVIIQPPESMYDYVFSRGWMQPGETLLKTVHGLPGDTYCITDQEIKVNGKRLGPIFEYDRKGLPMPKLRGTFTVQEGDFLPLALYAPNSFDGRYFGELPTTAIVRKVILLYDAS